MSWLSDRNSQNQFILSTTECYLNMDCVSWHTSIMMKILNNLKINSTTYSTAQIMTKLVGQMLDCSLLFSKFLLSVEQYGYF